MRKKRKQKKQPAQARKGASRKDKTAFIDYSARSFSNFRKPSRRSERCGRRTRCDQSAGTAGSLRHDSDHLANVRHNSKTKKARPAWRTPFRCSQSRSRKRPLRKPKKPHRRMRQRRLPQPARTNTNRTRLTDELLSNAAAASNTHSKPMDLAAYLSRPARTSSKDGDKE